jgi:preprotein translocase subunit SecA
LTNLRQAVTAQLMRVELVREAAEAPQPAPPQMVGHHIDPITGEDAFADSINLNVVPPQNRNPQDPSTWGKIARNEACPCGSGKKYKHCHGAFEA